MKLTTRSIVTDLTGAGKTIISLALVWVLAFSASCTPTETPNPNTENPGDGGGNEGGEEGGSKTQASVYQIPSSNTRMPGVGTIESQYEDSPLRYGLRQLIDGDMGNYFATSHDNFHITWKGTQAAAVNYYYLASAQDAPEKDPRSWKLHGSNNNGASWILIDSRNDQTFTARGEKKEYNFENKTAFSWVKLTVESNGGGEQTLIADFSLKQSQRQSSVYTIPAGNTRMPAGGTIESQYEDSPTLSGLAQLIDGNSGTLFSTTHGEFHITWKGVEAAAVNRYCLIAANSSPEKDPRSWTLQGSNDNGASWTTLDSREDQTFASRGEKKEFDIENDTPYKWVRLTVKSNNGGEGSQIAEFSLVVVPPLSIDELMGNLMSKSVGNTRSGQTPMGQHFENGHVATAEEISWLGDPSQEPDVKGAMNDWNTDLTTGTYSVNLYPNGNPSPKDVNQHSIGDCSALAVFASWAYMYPDFIKSIITQNSATSFTVKMYDPQGKPIDVTVSNNFAYNSGARAIVSVTGKNDTPCWSTVLEKALMKWQQIYKENTNRNGGGTINAIGSEHAAPPFTGKGSSFAFSSGVLSNAELSRAVRISLGAGQTVVGGFRDNGVLLANTDWKTVNGHAWTILHKHYSEADYMFLMRNPWGASLYRDDRKNDSADGLVSIYDASTAGLIDLRIIEPGDAGKFKSTWSNKDFFDGTYMW